MSSSDAKFRGASSPASNADAALVDESQVSHIAAESVQRIDDANDTAPRELGGRGGPEPTRYGDWEKNGRCIDF